MNKSLPNLNNKNKPDLESITEEIFNLLTPENQKELTDLINNTLRIEREMEELNKKDGDEILGRLKRREYLKKYRQREEVKERRKEYQIKYRQRPKTKERRIEYQREYQQNPKNKKYKKEYKQRPGVRERINRLQRERYQIPEVRERIKRLQKESYQRKKSNKL